MGDRANRAQRKHNRFERKAISTPSTPWLPIAAEMLESPAYRVLSRAARMCLDRIVIAHTYAARSENGRLHVSYDEFEAYGVSRKQIRSALDELDVLGFVKCSRQGRRGHGVVKGEAAEYRLTFDGVIRDEKMGKPTDEWRAVATLEDARSRVTLHDRKCRKIVEQAISNTSDEPRTNIIPFPKVWSRPVVAEICFEDRYRRAA